MAINQSPCAGSDAKARGVKLGWSNHERAFEQCQAVKKGAAVNRARALTYAAKVLPVISRSGPGARTFDR